MPNDTLPPPTDVEQRVRDGLAELVAGAPDMTSRWAEIDRRVLAGRRRVVGRREFLVGAAATTAVAGAGLTWFLAGRDHATRPNHVIAQPGPTTSVAPAPRVTGWHNVPLLHLTPRRTPVVVWADDRLIVWGGVNVPGPDYNVPFDGASWMPGATSWVPMAPAPAGQIKGGFSVWDGKEMLVGLIEAEANAPWNSQGTNESFLRYGIVAYNPRSNAWRYIAPLVPDADPRLGNARQAVLVGPSSLMVAVRTALPGAVGHTNDVVLVDTITGKLDAVDPGPFAASPSPDALGSVSLTVVGEFVVATTDWDRRPWTFDIGARTWRQVSGPPASGQTLLPATSAGAQALFLETATPRLWKFDPAIDGPDAWHAAAPHPDTHARWSYDPVWSGRELFVPGAAYDPSNDAWRMTTPPPLTKDRAGIDSRWAGDGLLLFGGVEYDCIDTGFCGELLGPDTLDGVLLTTS